VIEFYKYLILALVFIASLNAKIVTITGESEYRFSDKETFADAKDKCLEMAKKDAVGKFATSISNVTIVNNSMLEKDQLIAISLGIMRNIEYIEKIEERENSRIFYKISGEIDEEQVWLSSKRSLKKLKRSPCSKAKFTN
jgi:hypothetical protein